MAQLVFVSHLPLLRTVDDEDVQLAADTFLTKLSWEQFDQVSGGGFEDWRPRYERCDPVFLWFQGEVDWEVVQPGPGERRLDVTVPSGADVERTGHPIVDLVWSMHVGVTDAVWAAFALAAPAGVAAPPRSSLAALVPAGGEHHLAIGGERISTLAARGDAGIELAFLPDAAATPLDAATVDLARDRIGLARECLTHPELGVALRHLTRTGDLTLGPTERALLATTALEDLLVPDAEGPIAEPLGRRAANLLGADDGHRERVATVAREVYRGRNRLVHGVDGASAPLPPHAAAQLLAGAIEGLALAVLAGDAADLGSCLASLDEEPAAEPPLRRLPLEEPPGTGPRHRLGPRRSWSSATWSSTGSMGSPEGTLLAWSPLVGLTVAEELTTPVLPAHVVPVPPGAVASMEDKDTRRDFAVQLDMLDGDVAVLAVLVERTDAGVDDATQRLLERVRDLAVAGLRLAGADAFVDPELLGTYVFDRSIRHRRETVLRQSVLTELVDCDPVVLGGSLLQRAEVAWSLLGGYEDVRDPAIDDTLTTLRRIHDRRHLDPQARALLAFRLLELLLGRFRGAGSPVRPEALARTVGGVPTAALDWFEAEGRALRNATTHAPWTPDRPDDAALWHEDVVELGHLLALLRMVVAQLVRTWVEAEPAQREHHGPAGLLQRELRGRVGAG